MFRFKQFSVDDSRSPMKVGTDGVLLGAWFEAGQDCGRILDIGTGCGVIALMAAQRTGAAVEAIDIDPGCIEDARENVAASPWSDRITAHETSLVDFVARCGADRFDHILSNPPYFVDSLLPPQKGRTRARHAESLPSAELAACVAELLAPDGIFSIILPPREARLFVSYATEYNLYLRRLAHVHTYDGIPPKRVLMEFRFGEGQPGQDKPEQDKIVIHEIITREFTTRYRELTKDFYLKF